MPHRTVRMLAASFALSLALAVPVSAHGPTCADVGALGIVVHGQHVVRDYVTGGSLAGWPPVGGFGSVVGGTGAALPGGPGPGFHFPNAVAPGASFCLANAQSPGSHVD